MTVAARARQQVSCTQRLCNLREEEQNGNWGKPYLQFVEPFTTRMSCKIVEAVRP